MYNAWLKWIFKFQALLCLPNADSNPESGSNGVKSGSWKWLGTYVTDRIHNTALPNAVIFCLSRFTYRYRIFLDWFKCCFDALQIGNGTYKQNVVIECTRGFMLIKKLKIYSTVRFNLGDKKDEKNWFWSMTALKIHPPR